MYFGPTNSPATFQTMMNEIFQDLITKGVVSVYLDDILIFTNSLEEHSQITRLMLDHMHEHKLYLRPEKCEFEKARTEYPGVIISHNKVEMDLVKIAGVADWLMPSNKKEVGFVNFYQRFIPGFSHHTRCGEQCPSAFNSFELPSWMLYQDVQLLWDSGLSRGESSYSL
jgi:hypothetical protein